MKQYFSILFFLLLGQLSFAQNLPDYTNIKLDKKEDFTKEANDAALQASNFILSTPLVKDNMDRLKSTQYILRWMTGTPDFTFSIDEEATKIAKKDNDLLGLYLAAMTKYALENPADSKDAVKVKLNAVKSVITYAKNAKNNVKINGEIKKLIEADYKGQLPAYLKI